MEFRTEEGDVGVLPGHEAMTYLLSPGVLKIHEEGGVKKAALHMGFAEILPDEVRILAQIAEWPEEIDVKRAEEAKIRSERHLADKNWDHARAMAQLRRSLVRMEVASRR